MMHNLFRTLGEIKRPLRHIIILLERILERMDIQMVNEQEVKDALTTLQNDLATKFGEVLTEVQAIEAQVASGQPADLTALKDLVTQADTTVKDFALPAPPAPIGGAPAAESATDQSGGAAAPGS